MLSVDSRRLSLAHAMTWMYFPTDYETLQFIDANGDSLSQVSLPPR